MCPRAPGVLGQYQMFKHHLAAYGYPVVRSWLRRGVIYQFCTQQGRPARVTAADRLHLSDTTGEANDDRAQLPIETNARALRFFEEHALRGRGWSYEGGASLRTYYVGACLFAFPNVLQRWSGERRRSIAPHQDLELPVAPQQWSAVSAGIDLDPALAVTSAMTVHDALAAMPASTREVAEQVVLGGASFAEVAATLGVTERAVEGGLYQYRSELTRRGRRAS